jgi:amidohydrolase
MTTTNQLGSSLLADAAAILPDVVTLRRRLHRRPEVGLDLPETQALVADELRRLGLEPRLGRSVSSVSAVIEGARPGPTVLLRGDMDGLPVNEDTGLPFASEIPGTMHACGHDTHVAMLIGAARLLRERRASFGGRVLLMFQPGEEGRHGARFMLEEGLLDDEVGRATVAAFAIHISTRYESGTIDFRPGPMMAAADTVHLTVRGRGGHASTPHLAVDPIPVAAELILALQSMVTRNVDVFDPAVVTIAHVESGTTNNIIPERVAMEGTIRTFSEAARTAVHERIRRTAEGVATAHGAAIDVEIEAGYPVTVNDPEVCEVVRSLAEELTGKDAVVELSAPIMGAEDFSYVLERVPGMMAFLGARPAGEDPDTAPQNHSNLVVFEESPMALGVALHAAVALHYLGS